jgi:hypothetical protein
MFCINISCEVEPEIYSEVLPEEFFQTPDQLASATSVAYLPLGSYWGMVAENSEIISDVGSVSVRSNNGWDDGGVWPRLMAHTWTPDLGFIANTWNNMSNGVATTNRLIEVVSNAVGPDSPGVAELKTLRAFYFYKLLSAYGNIPIESRFSDADPNPAQVSPQEAFNFIENELLTSIDLLSEDKGSLYYGKVNKWVGYSILTDLYLNSERITGIAKWSDAANAANVVINGGGYNLESGYFANFRANNAGSSENIWVVPYERNIFNGFIIRMQALHQSSPGTFDLNATPWGGFAFQTEFYESFEEDDYRKGMFIIGQQYTSKAGPNWSDTAGFNYSNPADEFKLENCIEDFDNYTAEFQAILDGGCNIFITPEYNEIDGRYPYRNGPRWGKFELPTGEDFDISTDFPIYRLAGVMLARAEALWRLDNNNAESLVIVNQIRSRAGLDNLVSLSEDDLYQEMKKELALEGFSRAITIRFDHWEDDWFLKGIGNMKGSPSVNLKDATRRFFPIPINALQSNSSLVQNPGY